VEIKDKVSDAWYTGAGGHTKAKESNTNELNLFYKAAKQDGILLP
jgi:hypothetical protein